MDQSQLYRDKVNFHCRILGGLRVLTICTLVADLYVHHAELVTVGVEVDVLVSVVTGFRN